jgi:hypothetical protein
MQVILENIKFPLIMIFFIKETIVMLNTLLKQVRFN